MLYEKSLFKMPGDAGKTAPSGKGDLLSGMYFIVRIRKSRILYAPAGSI
jgi:hypothetical protein